MPDLQVIAPTTLPPGEQGKHYELIKQAIPSCLVISSPERRQALKQTPANIPSWYDTTSQAQKDQLNTLLESRCHALNELEKSLSKVQALEAFAQPLLEAALKAAGHALDVNQTWLRLYVPVEDAFGRKTGGVNRSAHSGCARNGGVYSRPPPLPPARRWGSRNRLCAFR